MRLFFSLVFVLSLLFSAASQTKVKVACVGNSITEGASIEAGKKYPDQLQGLLGDQYEVRNYGISGRTLLRKGDFPYWNEKKYQEVLSWNPDIIVIKLGTNDSKPQNWIYKDQFEKDYRDFIRSFKSLPGKKSIYVCYPIPVFETNWGITDSIVREEIIPFIDIIVKKEKVPLIDLYNPMVGKGPLVPDGVHPDGAGAMVIASTVYVAIHKKRK
jgi:lysophospholipase L1-like esterase